MKIRRLKDWRLSIAMAGSKYYIAMFSLMLHNLPELEEDVAFKYNRLIDIKDNPQYAVYYHNGDLNLVWNSKPRHYKLVEKLMTSLFGKKVITFKGVFLPCKFSECGVCGSYIEGYAITNYSRLKNIWLFDSFSPAYKLTECNLSWLNGIVCTYEDIEDANIPHLINKKLYSLGLTRSNVIPIGLNQASK